MPEKFQKSLLTWLTGAVYLPLILIFLVVTVIIPGLKKNQIHLLFVKNVDSPSPNALGFQILRNPDQLKLPQPQITEPCFYLWQSYVWASYDLVQAVKLLEYAGGCPRLPESQLIWRGNLAWFGGQPAEAARFWQQVSDRSLLRYARTTLFNEEKEVGLALVNILSQRAQTKPVTAANGPFFSALAALYRYAGQEVEGLPFHLLAWQAGQQGYEQAYYLGRGLAQVGDCGNAVKVLAGGYNQKPNILRPQLDTDYFIIWGSCFVTLNMPEQARYVFGQAVAVLEQGKNSLSTEVYQSQIDRIERLSAGLQIKD